MWGSHVDRDQLRRHESSAPGGAPVNQWHTVGDPQPDADRLHPPTTTHPTEDVEETDSSEQDVSGTWGERDVGHFDPGDAMENYEELRKNLTDMERTRSRDTQASRLKRTMSGRSRKTDISRPATRTRESEPGDVEAVPNEKKGDEDDFELDRFMREGYFEKRSGAGSAKKVGVIYKHLTVKGVGSAASFVRTLPNAIIGTFGPDLYHIICRFVPALARRRGETRDLIHDFTGCVRDGEMMLVLGRPAAGCSTFLKAIANNRESYAAVEGEVTYGGIPADKQKKMYRGEVNYNPEDDVHFASLSVWQTFTFALMTKTKRKAKQEIPIIANALLKMFGIAHTKYTLVGDEYTRGVSGGERKRVSIAETLASKSTVICWDNSTRGLDVSRKFDDFAR
jgi:ATP-binding cassette, subfamily G (WHITE), member 2, SNQ2